MVVAASDSVAAVVRTLTALGRQRGVGDLELIVAAARDRVTMPLLPAGPLGGIQWVIAPPGTSVPRLRRQGLDRATAPLVAFTEDSCVFGPRWAEAWVAAFADPHAQAATGPVEAAMGHAPVDWAVFLCEYAPFLAEDGPGSRPPRRLAGNNFAVRRSDLGVLDRPEIHETDVAGALAGRPGALLPSRQLEPGTSADTRSARRSAIACGSAMRTADSGRALVTRWARVGGVFAGPAILGVQAARLTALLIARRRNLGRFLEVLPVTVALLSAWSVGEWLGWLTASLPPSARKRRERGGRPAARGLARARWRSVRCTVVPPAA